MSKYNAHGAYNAAWEGYPFMAAVVSAWLFPTSSADNSRHFVNRCWRKRDEFAQI